MLILFKCIKHQSLSKMCIVIGNSHINFTLILILVFYKYDLCSWGVGKARIARVWLRQMVLSLHVFQETRAPANVPTEETSSVWEQHPISVQADEWPTIFPVQQHIFGPDFSNYLNTLTLSGTLFSLFRDPSPWLLSSPDSWDQCPRWHKPNKVKIQLQYHS